MKTTVRAAVVLAAAVVCGCGTLRTERLKAGMTQDEVTALYEITLAGSGVRILSFSRAIFSIRGEVAQVDNSICNWSNSISS